MEQPKKSLTNLEMVLFRRYDYKTMNLTINPDKAKIAVENVETVGYVIGDYDVSGEN